ncbi:MarR family transcriptional regulator [Marinomonas gallaica]|uniref:MarR family transcriptional regulator n=1 Tax=Marinomonas gallaica TaxID=1806667 RepID=UPI000836E15D|nr:MarR family transcriptional regulator [Marinomonas gallaica]
MQHTDSSIAVITGDLINSTKLTTHQFEEVLGRIKTVQAWVTAKNASNAHSIDRGDEFQTVIQQDIENVLRYAIVYRVAIKSLGKPFDSRISLAIAAHADIRSSVSESMGTAFILSGRALKALKNDRIIFTSDSLSLTEHFELLLKYLDKQLSELTSRQCEVLLTMLQSDDDLTVSELATKLDIATATASKSLKASGWKLIDELIIKFKNHVLEYKNA